MHITVKGRPYPFAQTDHHVTLDLHQAGCAKLWLTDDPMLPIMLNNQHVGDLCKSWVDDHTARQVAHMIFVMVRDHVAK